MNKETTTWNGLEGAEKATICPTCGFLLSASHKFCLCHKFAAEYKRKNLKKWIKFVNEQKPLK